MCSLPVCLNAVKVHDGKNLPRVAVSHVPKVPRVFEKEFFPVGLSASGSFLLRRRRFAHVARYPQLNLVRTFLAFAVGHFAISKKNQNTVSFCNALKFKSLETCDPRAHRLGSARRFAVKKVRFVVLPQRFLGGRWCTGKFRLPIGGFGRGHVQFDFFGNVCCRRCRRVDRGLAACLVARLCNVNELLGQF